MKKSVIVMILMLAVMAATGQDRFEMIVQQIEANNTALAALQQQTDAAKAGNSTGLMPDDPEMEFGYLWGSPRGLGNRVDVNITQSFDFPSVYVHRGRMANLQNRSVEYAYRTERLKVLLAARQACVELAYRDALAREYEQRLQNILRIAGASREKLAKGESNVLDDNKIHLSLAAMQADAARIDAERTELRAELKRMNGGRDVEGIDSVEIRGAVLPGSFEEWFVEAESRSPALLYVRGQVEMERQQVKLNRAEGLPGLSAGYISEKVAGEHFQGVTLGISVPLWENRSRVKQARMQVQAAELALGDSEVQLYHRLQALYLKAESLQQSALRLRQALADNDNEPLLRKALDAGEISLLSYLTEVEYCYEAVQRTLETERDFELAVAELYSFAD